MLSLPSIRRRSCREQISTGHPESFQVDSPSKQAHHRLAYDDSRLWNLFRRRIAGILHHLEERAFFEIDGRAFATFVLEVALDGVDMVG